MAISHQNKRQIIKLIAEGECLNIYDLEEFYSWMEASYEALKLNPRVRERFDEYCRSSRDSTPLRVCAGVLMLKDALNGDSPNCAAMDARV